MLEDIQIKQYFERIGYCQAVYTNLETLSGLQWAHITHIPYENLDILARACLKNILSCSF